MTSVGFVSSFVENMDLEYVTGAWAKTQVRCRAKVLHALYECVPKVVSAAIAKKLVEKLVRAHYSAIMGAQDLRRQLGAKCPPAMRASVEMALKISVGKEMTVVQLRAALKESGLETKGLKAELVQRLLSKVFET